MTHFEPVGSENNSVGKTVSPRLINSFFWVACGKAAQSVLQFLMLAILARLLAPEDFGIIGAAMIVIGFSDIITELGFEAAIVQRENLEKRHLATAFTVSFLLSCAAGCAVFMLAPVLADFFNSPLVETVLQFLTILFPLRGLGTIGEAMAQREMRFRWLAARDAASYGIGYLIIGTGLALTGFGVWSLAGGAVAAAGVKAVLLLIAYPPPGIIPERRALRELLYFGGGHTLARLSNYAALQGDNFVIARTLDLFALGIYGRAYQLMSVPATVFGQILDRVMFPSMARKQNRKENLSRTYLQGCSVVAAVMIPLSVAGFLLAPEIVRIALGEKWSAVILPFRILLVGLLMRTSYKLSDSLARATGAVYRRAWRQAVYAVLVILGAYFGSRWGVSGAAGGVLFAVAVNFFLMAELSLGLIECSWKEFFFAHLQSVNFSLLTAAIVFPLNLFFKQMALAASLRLVTISLICAAAAAAAVKFAPRFFLGEENMWLADIAADGWTNLRKSIVSTKPTEKIEITGAKNAGVENS